MHAKFTVGTRVTTPIRTVVTHDHDGRAIFGPDSRAPGIVMRRHSGVPGPGLKDWAMRREVMPTRDSTGRYMVQCNGVVVFAREDELVPAP